MENFFSRYKNPLVLMLVLFIQVVGLATQVKRPDSARGSSSGGGPRLIRVWTVTAFTPVERMFISTGHFFRDSWHNYLYLRGIRKENRDLHEKIAQMQMEQVRLKQDADQAKRLQALLEFREKFITKTLPAQVIATSGTEQSRLITIDKGSHDGIRTDMAVITPDGIVGKVKEVFPMSSQVLLINDRDSGAGVVLETSRLQGILKGTSLGELQISDVMSDEKVEPGEHVITSGGDRIYPKGLSVGTVTYSAPDRENDPFLAIKIKPAADLRRLEEVLVITRTAEEPQSVAGETTPMRAADILAQRLPSISRPDTKTDTKTDPNAAKPGTSTPTVPSPVPDKKPAAVGQGSQVVAGGSGVATPTPTPRPKKALKKPILSGTPPEAPAQATPATTPQGTAPPLPTPSGTPVPDGEKPPR